VQSVDAALSTVYSHTRQGAQLEADRLKAAADKLLVDRARLLVDALYKVRQAIVAHKASQLVGRIFRILRAPLLAKVVDRKY